MNKQEDIEAKIKQKNQAIIATITDPTTKDIIKFNIINEHTLWRAKTMFSKEPITIKWIRSFKKNSIFFDVGANVGIYSIFAGIINSSKVYSFEPESNNYQVLMQNIIINNLSEYVIPFQIGISDKTELTNLNLNNFAAGLSHHTVGENALDHSSLKPIPSKYKQGVFSTTLDDLCSTWKFETPTYIKIDVDGIEYKIISKSINVLSSQLLKSVLIEINENREEDKQIIKTMKSLKFQYDYSQVNEARRKSGPHEGYAEYLFYR